MTAPRDNQGLRRKMIKADVMVDRDVTVTVRGGYPIKDDLKAAGFVFEGVNWVLKYPLTAKTADEAKAEAAKFQGQIAMLKKHGVAITKFGAVDRFLAMAK